MWKIHFSKQADFTELLVGHTESGVRFEIQKQAQKIWTLKVAGKAVASLEETNGAAPMYTFLVKATEQKIPVGTQFDIRSAGPAQLLFCDICMQSYLGLPTFWSREK